MTFKRLLNLRLLRNWRQISFYSTTTKFLQISNVNKFGLLIGSLAACTTSFLLYKRAKCLAIDVSDKQAVPRRLQRFLSFASAEYNGCVYMTPQDLLDSLVLDQPRGSFWYKNVIESLLERVFRNVLDRNRVEKFLRLTPNLKKADKSFFRRLGHDGIISYSEYLFLLTLLTKSQSSFKIAFQIFDDDGNQRIDKEEFLKIRSLINCGLNSGAELVNTDFEQLSTSKSKNADNKMSDDMRKAVTLPENTKRPETTILIHLFGSKGRNLLTFDQFQLFYTNLQNELVEIEFNEFARGKDDITIIDFTRLVFRYTTVKADDQSVYIQRVNERMSEAGEGITKLQFEQFSKFLNSLEDFARAVKLYTNANIPVNKTEFIRAVKCSTNLSLDSHLVDVLFIIFDKNKDGQLSYSEFLAIMNDRVNRGFKNQTGKMAGVGRRAFRSCLVKEITR